ERVIDIIEGVIDRRILVNYRMDPSTVQAVLPDPFRPRLVKGYALGGICMIRFKKMRPAGFPALVGTSSENGTHRFCVEWDEGGVVRNGIYVRQRFTSSRLHEFGGDKIFPGKLTLASFNVSEEGGRYNVAFQSKGGESSDVSVEETSEFPRSSIFESIEKASADFRTDKVGYSPNKGGGFKGVQLNTTNWEVSPLAVVSVTSSLFSNEVVFPEGTIAVDHALLMKDVEHSWRDVETICCGE
ncbi:MAG: hypothetical protein ACI9KE_003997, partial [Polyangiales bacterium]